MTFLFCIFMFFTFIYPLAIFIVLSTSSHWIDPLEIVDIMELDDDKFYDLIKRIFVAVFWPILLVYYLLIFFKFLGLFTKRSVKKEFSKKELIGNQRFFRSLI